MSFHQAVELAPAADDLKVTLASCLVHLEEYDKAISVLKYVVTTVPLFVVPSLNGFHYFYLTVEMCCPVIPAASERATDSRCPTKANESSEVRSTH